MLFTSLNIIWRNRFVSKNIVWYFLHVFRWRFSSNILSDQKYVYDSYDRVSFLWHSTCRNDCIWRVVWVETVKAHTSIENTQNDTLLSYLMCNWIARYFIVIKGEAISSFIWRSMKASTLIKMIEYSLYIIVCQLQSIRLRAHHKTINITI